MPERSPMLGNMSRDGSLKPLKNKIIIEPIHITLERDEDNGQSIQDTYMHLAAIYGLVPSKIQESRWEKARPKQTYSFRYPEFNPPMAVVPSDRLTE